MSEFDHWVGYTPADQELVGHMRRLWQAHDLPEMPTFMEWSKEFAREVYEIVVALTKPETIAAMDADGEDARLELLNLLSCMGVWDETGLEQKWAPTFRLADD